jgi:hypothetical protein
MSLVVLAGCAGAPQARAPFGGDSPVPGAAGGLPAFRPTAPDPVPFTLVKSGRKLNRNWLGLNEYFPVHYWYADILYRFGLHLRLSLEEKTLILGGILFNLDFQDPVRLVVDDYSEGRPLVVQLRLVEAQAGPAVLLLANVDPDTRIPVPAEKMLFHGYKQLYLLRRAELLSVWDLTAGERQAAPAGAGPSGPGRADIFDGDPDDDRAAERRLLAGAEKGVGAEERLQCRLDLARLYGARERFAEAELALASARFLLERELPSRQDLREAFGMTWEEIVIAKALKELGARPLALGLPGL